MRQENTYENPKTIHGFAPKEWLKNPDLFLSFCEKFLVIRPVGGGKLIPLIPTPAQCWLFNRFILPKYKAGEPVRINLLKARQLGFSTIIEAFIFWLTLGHKQYESLVISRDKLQARKTLFAMFRRFMDNFQRHEEFPIFTTRLSRQEELVFARPLFDDPKNCKSCGRKTFGGKCSKCGAVKVKRPVVYLDSAISVVGGEDGAGDKLGRGGTYQAVHCSEAAFWGNFSESITGLLAACHEAPETVVVVETTANGLNAFYDFWTTAPRGWDNVFVPWYWHAPYSKPRGEHRLFDEDEQELWKLMASDAEWAGFLGHAPSEQELWEKLFWRRHTIENTCLGDLEKFKQEYPSNPAEAFRFSGQNVFGASSLAKVSRTVTQPRWVGEISLESDGVIPARAKPTIVKVRQGAYGPLSVWEDPVPLTGYVIAADVAEGRAAGNKGKVTDYDYSAAVVFRAADSVPGLVQVATLHGNFDPDVFGFNLVGLAKHYNNALLVWEVNGPGAAIKMQVMDICRYRNIYLREEQDATTKTFMERPGWRTTSRTKPVAVTAFQRYVRSGDVLIRDKRVLDEMTTFQVLGPNQYGAETGHDDLVMAGAIACAVADVHVPGILARMKRLAQRKERKPYDYADKAKVHSRLGSLW